MVLVIVSLVMCFITMTAACSMHTLRFRLLPVGPVFLRRASKVDCKSLVEL